MDRGRGARLIFRRLLLVTLAIQAMTPDAHDLSSTTLFRLLTAPEPFAACSSDAAVAACDGQAPAPAPLRGASLPTETTDQDELPDEVCLPGADLEGRPFPRGTAGLAALVPSACEPCPRIPHLARWWRWRRDARGMPDSDLRLSVIRLTC